jgi:hypothetical protein
MISSCCNAPVTIGKVFVGFHYNCVGRPRKTYGAGYVCSACNQECGIEIERDREEKEHE